MKKNLLTIGVIAVVFALALATYVPFMDYRKDVAKYGTYSVHFQARFGAQPVSLMSILDSSMSVDYDPTPAYPNYIDWLFSGFSGSQPEIRDNGTAIYTVHVSVDKIIKEKLKSNLFDQLYYIFPSQLSNGGSPNLVLNETLGPFLAYNSTLPMKVVYTIESTSVTGETQTITGAYYVTNWKE